MKIKNKSLNLGSMLLEIILCIFLMTLSLTFSFKLLFSIQNFYIATVVANENMQKAYEKYEFAEAKYKQGFKEVEADQVNSNGSYWSTKINMLSDFVREVQTVSGKENFVEKDIFGIQTDYKNAASADTCSLYFYGDLTRPIIKTRFTLPADNSATALDVLNEKIYLTTNSSTQSKEDFFILDAVNKNNLVKLSAVNTGPGLASVVVVGSYAFAANTSVNGQLQVINIINPSLPVVMKNLKLENAGIGNTVFYYNKKIFLGLEISSGPELFVIDVQNPLAPFVLGSYEIGNTVNRIYIHENTAYVLSPSQQQLKILDITNPAQISSLGSQSFSGWQTQSAMSFSKFGELAVLGRAVGGVNNVLNHEIFKINLSNIASSSLVISKDLNASARDVFVRDGVVFLATNHLTKKFWLLNLEDFSEKAFLNLNSSVVSMDCEDDYFFLAEEGQGGVEVVTFE